MRLGRYQPRDRIVGPGPQWAARWIGRSAQQAAGGAVGEGRLAGPFHPGQQPGVVQPPLGEGVEKGGLGGRVRDQVEAVARMLAHSSRSETAAQTRASTASRSPSASMITQR